MAPEPRCPRCRAAGGWPRIGAADHTDFAAADFTHPADVLADPAVAQGLDFSRPIGLIQALVLHHIPDLNETLAIQAGYLDKLSPGSFVAISHACNPRDGSEAADLATAFEDKFHENFPDLRFRTPGRDHLAVWGA